jgi:hypothetical protein
MLGRWKMTAHWPMWAPGFIAAVGASLLWGVLTFIGSLVKAPGKLLKERDDAIEIANAKLTSAKQARLSLWITPIKIEKLGLVLPVERGEFLASKVVCAFVQNKGQQAINCHANILVEYGIKDWTKKKKARACWHKGNSLPYIESPLETRIDADRLKREKYCDSIEIPSGEICQFIIAILFESGWYYKWTVPYTYERGASGANQSENSYLEASTEKIYQRSKEGPEARITVTIIPDIPPVHDLPSSYIQIEGKEVTSRII